MEVRSQIIRNIYGESLLSVMSYDRNSDNYLTAFEYSADMIKLNLIDLCEFIASRFIYSILF